MAAKKKTKTAVLVAEADPRAPLDAKAFLAAAQRALQALSEDLLLRADGSPEVTAGLRARWEAEREARRTGDGYDVWRRHFVVQVGAGWILALVFARTLEDRGLVGQNRIAGRGAADSLRQFVDLAPYLTEREYLLTVFRELSRLPAGADLFDSPRNAAWKLSPSAEGAKALLELFRAPDPETPAFRFGQSDTRFLGDLYQNLDAETRERFALLQTPAFVEKYILDRTLERAIARFGLDDATVIDPTCGSGHFLLGAFERLVDHRLRKEPGLDLREAARRALNMVYGSDINPYAVAIARFRLTIAFLDKAGYRRLEHAPALPLHVVVADSLLHAAAQASLGHVEGQSTEAWGGEEFVLEDEDLAKEVLLRGYAAVVGNPPYITVKDAVLRDRYREMYSRSAAGKYSLAAPFTERFFLLARPAGFVGMITANSFMKREFGKKLIELFLPTVNIDGIVNTSGAYIPGHDTPTVLLFGTNEPKEGTTVLTVLAKRGEPSPPAEPDQGRVWRSIADHGDAVGFENDYVSVARIQRGTLEKHPWSLGGGGAAELKELLDERAGCRLGDLAESIGFMSISGEDDAFVAPSGVFERHGLPHRDFGIGEDVRDWAHVAAEDILFPYDENWRPVTNYRLERWLWPARTVLRRRLMFGKTHEQAGFRWFEFRHVGRDKVTTPLSIAFAEVASHNHFVLDRGGKVFKQTAPIVKLKDTATEDDHLVLLAYLNSSTACFWMKQVCFPKATSNKDVGDIRGKEEANRFAFSGTALQPMPVPDFGACRSQLVAWAREALRRAEERNACEPARLLPPLVEGSADVWVAVDDARRRSEQLRADLAALQENIDWAVYGLMGLIPTDADTRSEGGRKLATEESAALTLLETPSFKRPWAGRRGIFGHGVETFEESILSASVEAMATTVESSLAKQSVLAPTSLRQIILTGAVVRLGERLHETLQHVRGEARAVTLDALARSSVPFLAAYRYTDVGLEKRREWERVWELQRAEDHGESVPWFDPPPKFDPKDYRDAASWRLRGKLDVPKERFISYPGCESDEDKSPVYGWAGWNHLQQAQALATLYQKRKTEEEWPKERLVPVLAGIAELIPWVKQWHNEPSAEFGGMRLGDYFADFVGNECQAIGVTLEDLRAWRPVAPERKSRKKKDAEAPADAEEAQDG